MLQWYECLSTIQSGTTLWTNFHSHCSDLVIVLNATWGALTAALVIVLNATWGAQTAALVIVLNATWCALTAALVIVLNATWGAQTAALVIVLNATWCALTAALVIVLKRSPDCCLGYFGDVFHLIFNLLFHEVSAILLSTNYTTKKAMATWHCNTKSLK